MNKILGIICFFLDHWWSEWLMGYRKCWACGKIQTFNEFLGKKKGDQEEKESAL